MCLTFGSRATKSGIIVFVQQSQSGTLEASLLILIMSSSFCEYSYLFINHRLPVLRHSETCSGNSNVVFLCYMPMVRNILCTEDVKFVLEDYVKVSKMDLTI
jgi:hypothetical protein